MDCTGPCLLLTSKDNIDDLLAFLEGSSTTDKKTKRKKKARKRKRGKKKRRSQRKAKKN